VNNGNLVWAGTNVKSAAPQFLGPAMIVRIDSPPDVAGNKEYGTASFGAPPPNPAIQAQVVLVNDGVGTAEDGCETIQNAAQLAGKIALIERGQCNFTVKAKNAQNAGAIAVIVGNNTSGAPPAMGGSDPTITIPVVSITIDDLIPIEDDLALGNSVTATLGADLAHIAGCDGNGRPRMYAPTALANGSSVSHWDTPETPNLLMEPFINGDITGVDLTQYAFADIGWVGNPAAVVSAQAPSAPARAYAAPNPFATGTAIHFTLARPGVATVEIFDVNGALVRRLPASWRPSGAQTVEWDGTDGRGHATSAGIYFWRALGADESYSGRVARVN
jgi:hypothetical protein